MKTKLWRDIPICLGIVAFLAAIFWPVFPSYPTPKATQCLSNVKQSSLALILYAGDADDRLPPRDLWMDATKPYTKTETMWHCPSVAKGVYGYAFNGALSRASWEKLPDPYSTPIVYDSVNPIRNASDLFASLPLPGRHGRKDDSGPGKNNVAYADGHAKSLPAPLAASNSE